MYQPEKPCRSNPKTKTPIFWSQVTTHQSLAANIGTPSNGVVAWFSLAWGRNPVGVEGRRELTQGFSEGLRSNLGLEDEIPLGFSEVAPNPKGIPSFCRFESQRDPALQPLRIPNGFRPPAASNPKGIPPFCRSESQRDSALQPLRIPKGFRPSAASDPKGIPPFCRFESQRDSALQPGVARNELPRGMGDLF